MAVDDDSQLSCATYHANQEEWVELCTICYALYTYSDSRYGVYNETRISIFLRSLIRLKYEQFAEVRYRLAQSRVIPGSRSIVNWDFECRRVVIEHTVTYFTVVDNNY